MPKRFMTYEGAKTASSHVIKLLNSEKYKTEYLKVVIVHQDEGYTLKASSDTDPQMVSRFYFLLREVTKLSRTYTSV